MAAVLLVFAKFAQEVCWLSQARFAAEMKSGYERGRFCQSSFAKLRFRAIVSRLVQILTRES